MNKNIAATKFLCRFLHNAFRTLRVGYIALQENTGRSLGFNQGQSLLGLGFSPAIMNRDFLNAFSRQFHGNLTA